MTNIQRPIAIPEPVNNVDSLWRTTQALKEAVEVIQGIRGNREYALKSEVSTIASTVVTSAGFSGWPQTALELANGVTPTVLTFYPGNVFRYGAVADSALGAGGTDNTTAFQDAIDSGHAVFVPEGYFSIEGTLLIESGGSLQGGKTFIMTSNTRLERFSASINDPIIQIVGHQNYVDGDGGILSARAVGGFTEGILLVGVNPTETDNGDTTTGDMFYNHVNNFKLIGKSSNTAWDGSVGLYVNAASRKRGVWKTGNSCNVYYNNFEGIHSTQWDFPIHISSEASFNTFTGCSAKDWGHAAVSCLGYGNSWTGFISESPTSQNTTERFVIYLGRVNDPFTPETGTNESPSSTQSITGVSAANPAVITVTGHGLSNGDKVLIRDVGDTGAGTLEAAINDGFWEVSGVTANTFTINLNTTSLAPYDTGGTIQEDFLPNLGSRANQFEGSAEWAFSASVRNVRLMGWSDPNGSYESANGPAPGFDGVIGKNILRLSGTHTGGAGINGFSDRAGIRNNILFTHALRTNRDLPENHHNIVFRTTDDGGSGYYGHEDIAATFAGEMLGAVENTAYDVITIDNVGAGNGAVMFQLSYLMREDANDDCEGGEISWLCPVAGNSEQTAIKFKDFQANYNTAGQPFVNWSIIDNPGTASNTGKFTLRATTDTSIAGTEDLDIIWIVRIVAAYGVSLDFDADVTITNGGL